MLKQSDLDNFIGDLIRYRHGLLRSLLYTPGVRYLMEEAGAYWLLDAIASYQHDKRINRNENLRSLQFWSLSVDLEANAGVLYLTDGNSEAHVIEQRIGFTDFPLEKISIWVGDNGDGTRTAYLPSEH